MGQDENDEWSVSLSHSSELRVAIQRVASWSIWMSIIGATVFGPWAAMR
jgi:hypothetical protein